MPAPVTEHLAGDSGRGDDPRNISFADLVSARWSALDGDASMKREYAAKVAAFERDHGPILDVYWSPNEVAGVAITAGRNTRYRSTRPQYHRGSTWVAAGDRGAARVLFDCDTLAVRAEESLSPSAARIALYGIFSASTRLLSGERFSAGRGRDVLDELTAQLDRVKAHVDRAARAHASWALFVALLSGLAAVVGSLCSSTSRLSAPVV